MKIEKADQPRKIHLTLWSPSSAAAIAKRWLASCTPEGQEKENPAVRATDNEQFRFYQPATSERGGFYAEA
jgi:hypothetical protein